MKIYDLIISDAAFSMLDGHISFLANVSETAAYNTMNVILDSIEALKENPERYPYYENTFIPHGRYRKMVCARRYLVIYEVSDHTVCVDYIVDCRQGHEWMIVY